MCTHNLQLLKVLQLSFARNISATVNTRRQDKNKELKFGEPTLRVKYNSNSNRGYESHRSLLQEIYDTQLRSLELCM